MTITSPERIDASPGTQENLLSKVRIVGEREGGLLEAHVPRNLIYAEDVPVDEKHVQDLYESMRKEEASGKLNGQIAPVVLGELKGSDKLYILDGFHRNRVLELSGKDEVYAVIRLNCTKEQIVDHRIIAASPHEAVNLPRILKWSQDVWKFSPWAQKIDLVQAYNLRFAQKMTGKNMGLTKEEVGEIKRWVDEKNNKWGVHAPTFHKYLATAKIADPELLKSARSRGGGSNKMVVATPSHIVEIAKALPFRFELQNVVVKEIVNNQLGVPEGKALAKAISKVETIEEAQKIIQGGLWRGKNEGSSHLAEKKEENVYLQKLEQDLILADERFLRLSAEASRLIHGQSIKETVAKAMRDKISFLSPEIRLEFTLQRIYGFSPESVAKVIGKTEADVIKDIHEAWELIKKNNLKESPIPTEKQLKVNNIEKKQGKTIAGNITGPEGSVPECLVAQKAPVVLFEKKESEHVQETQTANSRPDDFREGRSVKFLDPAGGDMPGVVLETKFIGKTNYVRVRFPKGIPARGIHDGQVLSIPVNYFNQGYLLD
jgi:hypothetical protein